MWTSISQWIQVTNYNLCIKADASEQEALERFYARMNQVLEVLAKLAIWLRVGAGGIDAENN